MVKFIYRLLKNRRGSSPRERNPWKKRLMYLSAVAFVGTLLLGGLALWGTIAAVNQVAVAVEKGAVLGELQKAEEAIKDFSAQPITTEACIKTLTGLLSPEKWLTQPIAAHLNEVKSSCWPGEDTQSTEIETARLESTGKE